MKNLLRYLTSFETRYSNRLPLNSETHEPISAYEHPFGRALGVLKRWRGVLTSAHGHATAQYYWFIAIVLAVITLLEVWITTIGLVPWAVITGLIVMGLTKFALVAAFYMHLRFDHRLYTWMFIFCMVLGVNVFVFMLLLIEYFGAFQ